MLSHPFEARLTWERNLRVPRAVVPLSAAATVGVAEGGASRMAQGLCFNVQTPYFRPCWLAWTEVRHVLIVSTVIIPSEVEEIGFRVTYSVSNELETRDKDCVRHGLLNGLGFGVHHLYNLYGEIRVC